MTDADTAQVALGVSTWQKTPGAGNQNTRLDTRPVTPCPMQSGTEELPSRMNVLNAARMGAFTAITMIIPSRLTFAGCAHAAMQRTMLRSF
jgi:hypothetical protein